MNENNYPLFTYGTLKKGFGLHEALEDSPFIEDAEVKGFRMYSLGGFPGVKRDEKAGTIRGEIYEVTPRLLRRLDHIEGAYHRDLYPTTTGKWVGIYVYNGSVKGLKEVKDGVWERRL